MILKTLADVLIAIFGTFVIVGIIGEIGKLFGANDDHVAVLGMFIWSIIGLFVGLGILVRYLIWGI